MRVTVHSLGCRVNQYEAQFLAEALADLPGVGEVCVVNTCTVTGLADRKSRQLIARLRRDHPAALIVAVGCGVDGGAALRQAGADLVVGNRDKAQLSQVIAAHLRGEAVPSYQWSPLDLEQLRGPFRRARALLKVQDGCTQRCSFCRTWQVRGPLRSKSPWAAREEAEALAAAGHREIVLVGINLAQYGWDLPQRPSLPDLLAELLEVPQVRIRLSSLNPEGLSPELIALFAREPRLCPYLHLPLQSGDNRILAAMGRPYTAEEYRDRAREFLRLVPKATLGADVMVGFPGEDEEALQHTVDLLEGLSPLRVHIFRFSPRPGTAAARLRPLVPPDVQARRALELASLAKAWSRAAQARFLGKTVGLLLEEENGCWIGHTESYLRVAVRPDRPVERGKIVPVRVVAIEEDLAEGVMVDS